MPKAKDIYGTVFENGSAVLLARVVSSDGDPVIPTDFTTAKYSIREINACGAEATAVEGHYLVSLAVGSILYDTLQTTGAWALDSEGYNFRHEVDVLTYPAFPLSGRDYQVRYELLPISGQPVVLRFLLRAI